MFDGELVSEPVRCPAEDRGLAEGVQRRASAQQFGIPHAERVCDAAGSGLLHSGARGKGLKRRPLPLVLPHPDSNPRWSSRNLSYSYVNESWGQVTTTPYEMAFEARAAPGGNGARGGGNKPTAVSPGPDGMKPGVQIQMVQVSPL